MFNLEMLHTIREHEYQRVVEFLPKGAAVLEVGGGTGYQALRLQQDGFQVQSIDLPQSTYSGSLEFPVKTYDGRHIPFDDGTFDVVFSSNVLEHVPDLAQMHRESLRVLRPGGFCLHVMPTGAWRLWTNVAHYVELVQRLAIESPRLVPRRLNAGALSDVKNVALNMLRTMRHYARVPRHGEVGNALTEISTFSVRHWLRHFSEHDLEVLEHVPLQLFYTGHMVFGSRVETRRRMQLSSVLGSACHLYKVAGRT
jgi:SAM-dependent methyltransferase